MELIKNNTGSFKNNDPKIDQRNKKIRKIKMYQLRQDKAKKKQAIRFDRRIKNFKIRSMTIMYNQAFCYHCGYLNANVRPGLNQCEACLNFFRASEKKIKMIKSSMILFMRNVTCPHCKSFISRQKLFPGLTFCNYCRQDFISLRPS
jgi:hypothetical protein